MIDQEKAHWLCNKCQTIIKSGTIRYVNTDEQNIDLCESCYQWCWEEFKKKKKINSNNLVDCDDNAKLIFDMFCRDLQFIAPCKYHYLEMKGRIKNSDRFNSSLFRSFVEYSLNPCFGVLKQNCNGGLDYYFQTYEQVFHLICCISIGLNEIMKFLSSISKRNFVSICGKNNLYWYLCDYACFFRGFVVAPIHFALTYEETKYCVELTESQVIICTLEMLDLFVRISKELENVKYIIVMDHTDSSKISIEVESVRVITMYEVIETGKSILCKHLNENNKPRANPYPEHYENHETILVTSPQNNQYDPRKMWIGMEHESFILNRLDTEEDLVTLVFTSGSTGIPKGIMMSDRALRKEVLSLRIKDPKVRFSFCPLSHMSDRKYTLLAICNGARVGIFTREFEHIFEDIQKCRPVVMASTPRLFNVLYDEFKKVFELERIRWLSSTETDKPSNEKELEERVMSNFKYMLGGRVQSIILGGASSSPQLREFVSKCFHCKVTDGFGMSEAGGIMNNNRLNTTVEYKLIDVPDMNYFTTDKPFPRGELCVKTNYMFLGYYKNEDLTKNALDDDGWLHTNDIVEELGPREIRIIDRLKNIFKLSQGEFIAPAKIEDALTTSKFIFQAYIYGNVTKSYLVGILVPNQTVLKQFAIKEGLIKVGDTHTSMSDEEKEVLANNQLVKKVICEEIEKVAVNCSLLPFEVPKDFIIEFEPFSEKNDLLTSSMKVKRFGCEMKYKKQLEELYEKVEEKYKRTLDEDLIRELLLNSSQEAGGNMKVIDSLHAVKFSGIMKQKFNIDIPLSLIFSQTDRNLESVVSRVSTFVTKRQVGGSHHDWKKDIMLSGEFMNEITEITAKGKISIRNLTNLKKGILLTGATGFLGAFLLRDLLETILQTNHNVQIYCLIREKNEHDNLLGRLKDHLEKFKIWKDCYENRITIIKGDLQEDNLGLSKEEFNNLAHNIGIIYHNGAYVNSVMSYSQLFSSNAGSTYSLLKLACLSSKFNIQSGDLSFTPIILISTVGVVQAGLSEFDLPTNNSQVNNLESINNHFDQVMSQLKPMIEKAAGYNSTKFVAEQYIQQARLLGYPAAIFRPGMIGSDTENGISNLEDWVNRLVLGSFELGCFPQTKKSLNVIPVDIISKVVVELTQNEAAFIGSSSSNPNYLIFELANLSKYEINIDDMLSVSAHVQSKLSNKEPIPMVSYQEWKKLLNERVSNENNESLLRLKTLFKSDTEFLKSTNKLKDDHVQKVIEILSNLPMTQKGQLIPYNNLQQEYLEKQALYLISNRFN